MMQVGHSRQSQSDRATPAWGFHLLNTCPSTTMDDRGKVHQVNARASCILAYLRLSGPSVSGTPLTSSRDAAHS